MKFDFEFPFIKPVDTNHGYAYTSRGGFARSYKTDITKTYENLLIGRLAQYKDQINLFNDSYDENKHYLVVDYVFYMPILLKNKTRLNQKKGDWDAYIKIFQDTLFKRLSADDHAILNGNVTQVHSEKYLIKASISLRSLDLIR